MKTLRILFWLTLICGIIILSIGVHLSIVGQASDGYTSGRLGNINHGMVNGFSALFLGVFLLALAVGAHKMYKDEIKRFKKLK